MANLTIVVDEGVLKDARIAALEQGTTVNKVLAQRLRELAQEKTEHRRARVKAAMEEIRKIAKESGMRVGNIGWSRDDLYERGK